MRIGGVEVTPADEVLILPRATGDNIVIKTTAVDMSGFEEIYPKPSAPKRIVKGGVEDDVDNEAYIQECTKWGERRFAYLVISSLEPSEIEWETVDLEKPGTWTEWDKELVGAGFSNTECNRIIDCVMTANSLNEQKLSEARESFLRGQRAEKAKSSGQNTEPQSTPSGQPASDSD